MAEPPLATPAPERPLEDRLDSWKEIASYLKRDVTTVQRWEKREGMPVHRHLHDRMGSVYASRAELDAWTRSRNLPAAQESGNEALPELPALPAAEVSAPAQISLTTSMGFSPRLGPNYLLYVSATGASESIWKLANGTATELWRDRGHKSLAARQSPPMDETSRFLSGNTGKRSYT